MDRVHSFFKYHEEQFNRYIDTLREIVDHPGEKGLEIENIVRSFFTDFIPRRFKCSEGFVIDHKRNLSKQTDIIIYDEMDIPGFLSYSNFNILPVEAVSVVCEVKTTLNLTELTNAFEKFDVIEKMDFLEETFTVNHENSIRSFTTGKPNKWIIAYDYSWKTKSGFKKAIKKTYQKFPQLAHVKILIFKKGVASYSAPKGQSIEPFLNFAQPKTKGGDKIGIISAWFLYNIALPNLYNYPRGKKFWIRYIPEGETFLEYI